MKFIIETGLIGYEISVQYVENDTNFCMVTHTY